MFVILFLLGTSGSVIPGIGDSGGGSASSLENRAILENQWLDTGIKSIKFRNNYFLNISRVCKEQKNLRSIKKQPIYEEIYARAGRGDRSERVKVGEVYKILKNENEDGSLVYPTEYFDVPVRKKSNWDDEDNGHRFRRRRSKILYYKNFTIDFCTDIKDTE
jgi:hypothetical protein